MVIFRIIFVAFMLLSFIFGASLTNAQTRSWGPDNDPIFPLWPNSWYIATDTLAFTELIKELAPILWFSPHEEFEPRKFPFTFGSVSHPIVYYVVSLDGKDISDSAQKFIGDLVKKEMKLKFEYYFYYPYETGLGKHHHDLEGTVIHLRIFPRDPDRIDYYVEAILVKGLAHGHFLYDNELDLRNVRDRAFPLTLLVEEGKHASCPDRDQNGIYNPGFDTNRHINDSWGVRDVISTGRLYEPRYQTWMTKSRKEQNKLYPPRGDQTSARQYSLKAFPEWRKVETEKKLLDKIREKRDPTFRQRLLRLTQYVSFGYRYDGNHGIKASAFLPNELSIVGGFAAAKITARIPPRKGFSFLLLYLPSAARWFDWYAGIGVEKDVNDWSGIFEYGYKVRINKGLFSSITLGVKTYGFSKISKGAFVIEAGVGGT